MTFVFSVFILAAIVTLPVFFMRKSIDAFRFLMDWVAKLTAQDFRSYCAPELGIENMIVRSNGTIETVYRFMGGHSIVGEHEFNTAYERIMSIMPNLKEVHDIQIVYIQDFGNRATIDRAIAPSRASARRIGLSMDRIFDSYADFLSSRIMIEDCIMVVSTSPAIVDKAAVKEDQLSRVASVDRKEMPPLTGGQNPLSIIEPMIDRHNGFLLQVETSLANAGIRVERLNAKQGLSIMKTCIAGDAPGYEARIVLPGDPVTRDITTQVNSAGIDRISASGDLFYPPIWKQIGPRGDISEVHGKNEMVMMEVNGKERWFGTVAMEIPPMTIRKMNEFSRSMAQAKTPFRLSFRILGAGMRFKAINKALVSFFSMFPKSLNRKIKNAIDLIEAQSSDNSPMGVSISATTWGKSKAECAERLQVLSGQMKGWGNSDVSSMSGSPTGLYLSTVPGLLNGTAAPVMLFPASEVTEMLPLSMSSSPWHEGGMLFVDIERKKLMPYQPGSSLQVNWVSLIFARSGAGKSVLMLSLEESVCIAPGLEKLPLMTVIDVGESVRGLISMLQNSLPADRQHEAGYFKLQMLPEYAVNVMDTQLGFRYPLPMERDFLVTFISMLATPAGRDTPYDSVYEVMGMAVDEAYRKFSDSVSPKRYEQGINPEVDAALEGARLKLHDRPTWWEITDALFAEGLSREAGLAQRYAVPLISDITSILNTQSILDIYGKVIVSETQESLIDLSARMISSALREYRIFSSPTRWDLANCRVVGLDLNDVRGNGGSGAAKKQSALMYAFAQNLASRSYFIHADMLQNIPSSCPEMYRVHYQVKIADVSSNIKTIAFDEFHNTGGLEGIRKIVGQLIREGRKFGIQIMLASQLLDDFSGDMVENATSIYILPMDNPKTIQQCRNTFGLSDSAVYALEKIVRSRGHLLAVWSTSGGMGKSIHAVQNLLSNEKLWAYSTTQEARQIKKLLAERMPWQDAILALSKRFGTDSDFKAHIEAARRNMTDERAETDLIDKIANEILASYNDTSSN